PRAERAEVSAYGLGLRRGATRVEAQSQPITPTSSVVAVASLRRSHGGRHEGRIAGEHPAALGRCEPRCEVTVVDFSRHREALELRCGNEEPLVVFEAIGPLIDVSFGRGYDAVVVGVD